MRKRISTFLSEDEIADILRQPNRTTLEGKRDYAILFLMIFTGLRRNEVCELKKSNFQKEGKKVWLFVIGKGGKQRKIPIRNLELIEAIAQYWKKRGDDGDEDAHAFLTLGRKGVTDIRPIGWQVIRGIVEKYARQAKITKRVHPHCLRHTFITHALRKSSDLPAVQALAGHSSIKSTQVYLHTDDDRMERAVKMMG
jgi:site-specific recombinase XerD